MTDDEAARRGPRQTAAENEEASLLDAALALKRRWRSLVFLPILAGLLAFGLASLLRPTFTSGTQLLGPQQQSSASAALGSLGGGLGSLGGAIAGLKNPVDQWVTLLKSRTVAEALIDRFKLQEVYGTEYRFQTISRLAASTRINAGKDGTIALEVDDHDPQRAADLAQAYVDELQQMSKTLAVTEAAQRRAFFETQLTQAKDALVKAEVAVSQAGIGPGAMRANPDASVTEVGRLKALIDAQEVRISVLRGYLTDSNPELQTAQRQLTSLRAQMAATSKNDPAAGEGGADYIRRYRDFKYAETLFEMMARQFELAKADEAKEGALIQVIDPPQVPEWKSGPKRGLIAAAVWLAALLVTAVVVLLRHMVRSEANEETARKLSQLFGRFAA